MVKGSCLCGTVKWETEAPFNRMRHCHCARCRKAHGAPFATYFSVPKERFHLTVGAAAITRYPSSPEYHRSFCSTCGSVTPSTGNGDTVDVPAGCLDTDPETRPMMHIFAASTPVWDRITDDLPRHDTFEPGNDADVLPDSPAPESGGTLRGSCLCGGAEFEAGAPFRVAYHCHCNRCQKARAAAHTSNGSIAAEGLRYLKGEDLLVHFKVADAAFFTHTFCSVCGSGMVKPGTGERPFVTIPLASLDGDPGIRPTQHIYTNYNAPWFEISGDLPRRDEGPEIQTIDLFQDPA